METNASGISTELVEGRRTHPALRTFFTAALITAAVWLALGIVWDFYFDLNDDVLMKDILSGQYTGTPESRNIQMLYPISWLISRIYSVLRGFDVYGAALLFLQALSFTLVLARTLRIQQKARIAVWMRVITALAACLPMGILCLWHAVFVQYSVTCAFLCGAAAYLFLTMELPEDMEADGYRAEFVRACLPSLILLFISFPLRSEMTLLLMPLVLSAALFAYLKASGRDSVKDCFRKEGWMAILLVLVLLSLGLGAEAAADKIACRSPEWKEFRAYFDARTELYDYDGAPPVPDYEENKEYYDSIGVTKEETELLNAYNFSFDDGMDAEKMEKVAELAGRVKESRTTPVLRLRTAGWNYRSSMVSPDYMPYNVLAAAGYLLLLATALSELIHRSFRQKNLLVVYRARRDFYHALFSLGFLFLVRSALWMYIFWGGRYPDRITHSLFLVEFMVLQGLLLVRGMRYTVGENVAVGWSVDIFAAQLMLIAVAVLQLPGQVQKTETESELRAETNAPYEEYLAYCADHPGNFYFTDVYSTVNFSEKMFSAYPGTYSGISVETDSGNSGADADAPGNGAGDSTTALKTGSGMPDNHDITGGWAAKSPLAEKKLSAFGYDSVESALIKSDNAYFVAETGSDLTWLTDWYESEGAEITLQQKDTIGDSFVVWKIVEE